MMTTCPWRPELMLTEATPDRWLGVHSRQSFISKNRMASCQEPDGEARGVEK